MLISYDPQMDILRIHLSNEHVAECDMDRMGHVFDYDKYGRLVRVEIRNASKLVERPEKMEYKIDRTESVIFRWDLEN